MYICIVHHAGESLVPHHYTASPETFLKVLAPSREDRVVAVACRFTWYWLADLCQREGMACVLGHALSMQAIHGGTAKNDRMDAQKIAGLRRGGMLPQASGSPAAMRATRDLLRRRMHCMRNRAALLTHVQHTKSQDTLPEMGQKIADKAHRAGVAERCAEPAGQQRIAGDLALLGHDDALLRDSERSVLKAAKQHDAHALSLLRTVPGIGELLSLGLLYERHAIQRFPRVQDLVSSCRLGKGAQASAGTRSGTSGAKIGHAYLQWACSEAAVLCLRAKPAGHKYLSRLENKHGTGTALTVLAHTVARAVYDMLKRHTACDMHPLLHG